MNFKKTPVHWFITIANAVDIDLSDQDSILLFFKLPCLSVSYTNFYLYEGGTSEYTLTVLKILVFFYSNYGETLIDLSTAINFRLSILVCRRGLLFFRFPHS